MAQFEKKTLERKQWTFNLSAYLLVSWSMYIYKTLLHPQMCGKVIQGSKNVALILFSSVLTTKLVSFPDPTYSQEKNVTCLDTQAQQKGKKITAAGKVVCNNSQQQSLNHVGPYHILGIGPQHLPSPLHFPLGRYKTWTLDLTLDWTMDWIMDLNLDSIGKQIVFQICCLKRTLNAGLHMIGLTVGMDICALLTGLAGWFKPLFCS